MIVTITEAKIAEITHELQKYEPVSCPLQHGFTPGLYTREITMPAGTMVVSQKHLTEHPYLVMRGKAAVYNSVDQFAGYISAPFRGITKPGTQRLLAIIEEMSWVTFHPIEWITGNEKELPEKEFNEIIEKIELFLVGNIVEDIYK